MRVSFGLVVAAVAVFGAACQSNTVASVARLPAPQRLSYQLEPSGDPTRPVGILLAWDDVQASGVAGYRVYSRGSTADAYGLRGVTTSNTFHDNGVPHLQYFVTAVAVDGVEGDPSDAVTVNEYLQIAHPTFLTSISLDSAIHLNWDDAPFLSDSCRFKWYRVYSASYDLDLGLCGADWFLEGTTVSHEFLAAQLANGVPHCYGVSAVDILGYESLWSPLRQDTPRPDARNVLVWTYEQKQAQSGFRFWNDANGNGYGDAGELGLVQDGTRTDIDFRIRLQASDSTLWIEPIFSGTSVQVYGGAPIPDLTAIDFAPASGYGTGMLEAVPGYGYVFQIIEGSDVRYGALRVSYVGRQYLIFDWSFQTDRGNPELVPRAGLAAAAPTGSVVPGSK